MWAIRHLGSLTDLYRAALARTVGMASRCLLTPTLPRLDSGGPPLAQGGTD
jgi:hypothetical protein